MRLLTQDDILPLSEFAGQRREHFEAHCRYLDRYRRVRIGPKITLLFENRQTLWFRVQDILRIARLAEPAFVQQELDIYNRLLPGRKRLQAALLIALDDEARIGEELSAWEDLQGDHIRLCIGDRSLPAHLVTARPEDRCIGAAHWVQFTLDSADRRLLADNKVDAFFKITMPAYRHESPPLSSDIRQSLLEDLEMSDRD